MAVTLDNTVSMPETHRYLWNIGDWFHLVGAVDGHLWNPQGTADVSPFSPTSTQQHHINTSPTCILMQIHSTFFYWKAANTTKTTASFPLISSSITGSIQCYKTTGWKTSIKRSILESEMVHNQEDFTKSKNKPPPKKIHWHWQIAKITPSKCGPWRILRGTHKQRLTLYFSWHHQSLDRAGSVVVCSEHRFDTTSCPRGCSECRSMPKQTDQLQHTTVTVRQTTHTPV